MNNEEVQKFYQTLQEECTNNKLYFENLKDEKSQKLYDNFIILEEQISKLLPLLSEFREIAPTYDFKNIPANGYRSFIKATDEFSCLSMNIIKNITNNRTSLFFQKNYYAEEIKYCAQVFATLYACFQLLQFQRESTEPGKFFLEKPEKIDIAEKMLLKIDIKNFFGRYIGFQFGTSAQPVIKTLAIMMAIYSLYYFHDKNFIQCVAIGSKFFKDPELRAERITDITSYRSVTVAFCKEFLNVSETDVMKRMNVLIQPVKFINEVFELPREPLQYKSEDGHVVDIDLPSAHIGSTPFNARLLSSVKRKGMEYFKQIDKNKAPVEPPSDWLIFHVHGGGFIAQTSETHLVYLKNWIYWTKDTPIISIDYSLAPEAPYPRALEEILYAYVWTLNNLERLGTTAKRIVFAGDSAGGNLCLSLILKCIELNIRKPDGVFCAYTPVVLQIYPSPSRYIGLMDPLLSFGFMLSAIKAYAHLKDRSNSSSPILKSDEKRGLTSEDGPVNDNAEKESIRSPNSDTLVATNNSSSSSFLDDSLGEENLVSSDATTDMPSTENMNLPSNYTDIIRGFVLRLKEKFKFTDKKNGNLKIKVEPDFANIASLSQLLTEIEDNIFLSPIKADDKYIAQFPATSILSVEMDPCLDDCVLWAKRLDQVNVPVHFDVLPNLPHGFLNVALSSKEAYNASFFCAQRIKELLAGETPKKFQKL